MSLIPAKRYCDMCRGPCPPPPEEPAYQVRAADGDEMDYCSTLCFIQCALSFVPPSERSPGWEAAMAFAKQAGGDAK